MTDSSDTGNIELLHFSLFSSIAWISHGISTRKGGVSKGNFASLNLGIVEGDTAQNVKENRHRFLDVLDCRESQLAKPVQVHSKRVVYVREPGIYEDTDALVTDKKGLCLSVKTADCVPLMLCDIKHQIVGLVHAGWRGVVAGIITSTIDMMKEIFASEAADIIAGIGPAIRKCCYEIGNEVAAKFLSSEVEERYGRLYLDLTTATKNRLMSNGILTENIDDISLCTSCLEDQFYSHRRDKGRTGRMMTIIGMV